MFLPLLYAFLLRIWSFFIVEMDFFNLKIHFFIKLFGGFFICSYIALGS